MILTIFRETKTRLPGKRLQALFDLITEAEGKPEWPAAVNLVFVTDQKIRRLNRTHRGMDKATDVLSFPLDDPHVDGNIFGEVYISVATAKRQAAEGGRSLVDELLWLFCHGMLHLFCYDHTRKPDAARMKLREQYFLDQV